LRSIIFTKNNVGITTEIKVNISSHKRKKAGPVINGGLLIMGIESGTINAIAHKAKKPRNFTKANTCLFTSFILQ
jgi:hypothetical protein